MQAIHNPLALSSKTSLSLSTNDCEVTPSTSGRRSKLGSSEAGISGYERCSVAETSLVNCWRRRRPSTASCSRLHQDLPLDVDPLSPLRKEQVRVEEGGSWSPGYRTNILAETIFVDYLGRRRLSIVHGRLSRLSCRCLHPDASWEKAIAGGRRRKLGSWEAGRPQRLW